MVVFMDMVESHRMADSGQPLGLIFNKRHQKKQNYWTENALTDTHRHAHMIEAWLSFKLN